GLDRAALRGETDARRDLLPLEGLPGAVALHDDERHLLDALEGCEASPAVRAGPSAADRLAVVGLARVDDLVVEGAAGRTAHRAERYRRAVRRRRSDPSDPCPGGAARAAAQGRTRRWPTCSGAPPF